MSVCDAELIKEFGEGIGAAGGKEYVVGKEPQLGPFQVSVSSTQVSFDTPVVWAELVGEILLLIMRKKLQRERPRPLIALKL